MGLEFIGFLLTLVIASFSIKYMQKIKTNSKKQYMEEILAHIIKSITLLILYYIILCDAGLNYINCFKLFPKNIVETGLPLALSMLFIGLFLKKTFTFLYDKLLKKECVGEKVNENLNQRRLKGYLNNREAFMDLILNSFMTALMVAIIYSATLSFYSNIKEVSPFVINLKKNYTEFTNFTITLKWFALLLGKFVWFDGNYDWKYIKNIISISIKNIISLDNIISNLLFIAGIISGIFKLSIGKYVDKVAIGMLLAAILLLLIGLTILISNYMSNKKRLTK